jgi:hypothetical protein
MPLTRPRGAAVPSSRAIHRRGWLEQGLRFFEVSDVQSDRDTAEMGAAPGIGRCGKAGWIGPEIDGVDAHLPMGRIGNVQGRMAALVRLRNHS